LRIEPGRVINRDIIGLGVNVRLSQHTFYDYTKPPSHPRNQRAGLPLSWPYPNEDAGWQRMWRALDELNPQFVRLGVAPMMWEPYNDNDDPSKLNQQSGFTWSPKFEEAHPEVSDNAGIYLTMLNRIMRYFDRTDRHVMICNWHLGSNDYVPSRLNWLSKIVHEGNPETLKARIDKLSWQQKTHAPYSVEEFAESMAALIHYLREQKGYSSLKQWSIDNEPESFPNGFWEGYEGPRSPAAYRRILVEVHKALDEQLRRLDVRDGLGLVAIDGALWHASVGRDNQRVAKMLEAAPKAIDVISQHHYNSVMTADARAFEKSWRGAVSDVLLPSVRRALRQIGDHQGQLGPTPLVLGEIGSHFYFPAHLVAAKRRPHMQALDEGIYGQRLHNAEAAVQLLNAGVKAAAFWVFNVPALEKGGWSMMQQDPARPRQLSRIDPSFAPAALTMRHVPQGGDVVANQLRGGKDDRGLQRVFAMAVRGGDNLTVVLTNNAYKPAEVRITGLKGARKMHQETIALEHPGTIRERPKVHPRKVTEIRIPARGILVLTSYNEPPVGPQPVSPQQ
jgi:hypothetical protein